MKQSNKVVPLPDIDAIENQAAEWIMRLEDGDATPDEKKAFQAWLNQSEQHKDAFNRIGKLWGSMDLLSQLNDYAVATQTIALDEPTTFKTAKKGWFMLMAACIALVAVTGLLFTQMNKNQITFEQVYVTGVGQHKVITLPDGSVLDLNTNSRINVVFSDNLRQLMLLKGEAYFSVAHDKTKPFTVLAGSGSVTAVGTEFSVKYRNELVDVIVTQGRVALATSSDKAQANNATSEMELGANQSAQFDEKIKNIESLDEAMLQRKLSWRDGLLSFSGQPLADFITEFNRYSTVKIELGDPDLGSLPVSGYFKVTEVESILAALEVLLDIHVDRVSPNHVILRKK